MIGLGSWHDDGDQVDSFRRVDTPLEEEFGEHPTIFGWSWLRFVMVRKICNVFLGPAVVEERLKG